MSYQSGNRDNLDSVINSFLSRTNTKEEVLVIVKTSDGHAEVKTYSKLVKDIDTKEDTRNLIKQYMLDTINRVTHYLPIQSFMPQAFSGGIKNFRNMKVKSTNNPEIKRDLDARRMTLALKGFDPKNGKYLKTPYDKKNKKK